MPAPPEFPDGCRKVRRCKILHHTKAQYPRRANCDGGIACKITIDLNGIQEHRQHHNTALPPLRIAVDRVHNNRNAIRQDELEKIPPEKNQNSIPKILVAFMFLFHGMNLRQKISDALDGTGRDSRKEGNKQCIGNKAFFCLCIPPVAVDHIAECLQCIKRNSHWQKCLCKYSGKQHGPVFTAK